MSDIKMQGNNEAPTIVMVFTNWMMTFTAAEARNDKIGIYNLANDGLSLLGTTGYKNEWDDGIDLLFNNRDYYIEEVKSHYEQLITSQFQTDLTKTKEWQLEMFDVIDEINAFWGRAAKQVIVSSFPRQVFKFLNFDKGAEKLKGFDVQRAVSYFDREVTKLFIIYGIAIETEEETDKKKEEIEDNVKIGSHFSDGPICSLPDFRNRTDEETEHILKFKDDLQRKAFLRQIEEGTYDWRDEKW